MRRLKLRLLLLAPFAAILLAGTAFAQRPLEPATTGVETTASQVVVPVGTHLPLVLQNTINTRSARRGDLLYFETIYPVTVDNRVIIPAGSFVRGSLTEVKRPGRVKGRAQVFVRFDQLTLPNGYTLPLSATVTSAQGRGEEEMGRREGTVVSEGSKGGDVTTVATTGGTGAIVGAATGGGKGAAIGAGAGAAAGLVAVLLTRGKEVELPRGSTFDVVLDRELYLDASMVQFDSAGHPSNLPGPTPAERSDRRLGRRLPWPY